ncbi:MAG: hypothetical protein ACRDZ3_05975 [Acidimicrobiia bacterium]
MSLDRSLIESVRALEEPELRRLVILAQDLLARRGGGPVPAGGSKVTFRLENVRCGKANCTRCPHGPYWYAYWREDGKVKKRYLGTAKAK